MTNPAADNGAGAAGATASEAFNSKAWLQHYTPWTQHTIDLDDPAENPSGFTIPQVFWLSLIHI